MNDAVLMAKRLVQSLRSFSFLVESIREKWIRRPFTTKRSNKSDVRLVSCATALKRIRTIAGPVRTRLAGLNASSEGFGSGLRAVAVNVTNSFRHLVVRLRRTASANVAKEVTAAFGKFASLQTKLTILYAGLFGLALIVSAAVVYVAISRNAETIVHNELTATGTAFNHVWELKSNQLRESAELTADIAAFTRAVAVRNKRAIRSALTNLQQRFGFDIALTVSAKGDIVSSDRTLSDDETDTLRTALKTNDRISGVFTVDSQPYQIVSTPIVARKVIGWVVFGVELDQDEMHALERLAAIPLSAAVLHRDETGEWLSSTDIRSPIDQRAIARFLEHAVTNRTTGLGEVTLSSGTDEVLVKPLATIGPGQSVLLLRYPLALAVAPYRPLLIMIGATALIGLIAVVAGSWALARSLTYPISALVVATHRLERGEDVRVDITTNDELAFLGASFNSMAEEIQAREEKITSLALQDAETGLPNRRALETKMQELLATGEPRLLAVSAIGIDRFPFVRGAIGYGLATELVREIGQRLNRLTSQGFVSRLSTDILGLTFSVDSLEHAETIVSQVLDPLERPARVIGNTIDVSLTIGTAVQGAHGEEAEILLERATIALDQARAAKRKQTFFDPMIYGDPASNLSLISDMLRSLENGEMAVHYQPKLDFRSGRVTGAEALVRWNHSTRGMIRPDLFIGMAEETGQIRALTDWVLKRVIADSLALGEDGQELSMSINVSGRLMSDPDFAEAARDLISKSGARICAEITETAVIENPELALEIVASFKSAGIAISIDDYGSGLSSLSYLKQINADELKIDKSLILPLGNDKRDALLVKSTIDLAHGIGMKVTAEGIETDEAFALLAGMGCDTAQGYLIAKPMPFSELIQFLQQSRESTRQSEKAATARRNSKRRRVSTLKRA